MIHRGRYYTYGRRPPLVVTKGTARALEQEVMSTVMIACL